MKRILVSSSNLRSVGFKSEGSQRGTLEIEFTTGDIYRYNDVPADLHKGLVEAKSVGSFFSSSIKNNYVGKKIEKVEITPEAARAATRIRDLFLLSKTPFAVTADEIARVIVEESERQDRMHVKSA